MKHRKAQPRQCRSLAALLHVTGSTAFGCIKNTENDINLLRELFKSPYSKMTKKVLVVDDEPQFLQMLKMRLEANNYEVITASNGKDALNKVKLQKPDAVLLDILMPELDGLQTLKRIREENKKLPVFLVTAYSKEETFKAAMQLGASGFIAKTGDLAKQLENISSALGLSDKYKGESTP